MANLVMSAAKRERLKPWIYRAYWACETPNEHRFVMALLELMGLPA